MNFYFTAHLVFLLKKTVIYPLLVKTMSVPLPLIVVIRQLCRQAMCSELLKQAGRVYQVVAGPQKCRPELIIAKMAV